MSDRAAPRDKRLDILFDPVRIGPVVSKNRFFQVPHCNGMGRLWPSPMARMREVKAEGGWGVVSTEMCDIEPNSNHHGCVRLWDEKDLDYLSKTAELVHRHDALAAIELAHLGARALNLESRDIAISPSAKSIKGVLPLAARAMDKAEIVDLRKAHVAAAKRALQAGFDIIYVYAAHDITILSHFLSRRYNHRTDEYGGSLVNRARLLREVLEETKDAVGHKAAVAIRFSVEELLGDDGLRHDGEGRDVVAMLAELPDLWDVGISDSDNDFPTARFSEEGYEEQFIGFVKSVTTKPVLTVGRYTSPDRMADIVRKGLVDLIGAARPSIADPFLPTKVAEGRLEDIRECIGCNICLSGDRLNVPSRCTQNPTFGEEWRRGWHPERVPEIDGPRSVLVVGGGPAGLEAALTAARRGCQVMLAEKTRHLGGRINHESRLPGLATYARVRDWRLGQLSKLSNVETYLESAMDAASIAEIEADSVVIATGSTWRADGVGRSIAFPLVIAPGAVVLTPDDCMAEVTVSGRIVIYDDDHYYMGGVLAEKYARQNFDVTLVTPESVVSAFGRFTAEQARIQGRLLELGCTIVTGQKVKAVERDHLVLSCIYTGRKTQMAADTVVMVTERIARDELYQELLVGRLVEKTRIAQVGDCVAPGTVAAAVHSGHRWARGLGESPRRIDFRRENVVFELGIG